MKVVELPRAKTDPESAREFLTKVMELVDSGEYKPAAFVVLMIEDHSMVPLAVNLNKHEVISYLEIAKTTVIEMLRSS